MKTKLQFNVGFIDVWTLVHIAIPLLFGILLRRKWWWIGLIIVVGYELLENLLLVYLAPDFFGEEIINIISDAVFGAGATLLGSYISPFIFLDKKVQFSKINLLILIRGILAIMSIITYFILILWYSPFVPIFFHFYQAFSFGIIRLDSVTTSAYLYLGFAITLWAVDTIYTLYLGVERVYRRLFIYLYAGLNLFLTLYLTASVITSTIWTFTINPLFFPFIIYGTILSCLSYTIFGQLLGKGKVKTYIVMTQIPPFLNSGSAKDESPLVFFRKIPERKLLQIFIFMSGLLIGLFGTHYIVALFYPITGPICIYGVHIHHLYLGLILFGVMLLGYFLLPPRYRFILLFFLALGLGMALDDILTHFVFVWDVFQWWC